MIKKSVSEVRAVSPAQTARAVNTLYRATTAQQVAQARPQVVIKGVPGDPDQRRMLSDTMKNMAMVQVGNGSQVTNVLAYATNSSAYRDYDNGRYGGLYAPKGEYAYSVQEIRVVPVPDPDTGVLVDTAIYPVPPKVIPPSEVAVMTRATARPSTTNVLQQSDVW
jgi:hypothetical protein